MSSTVTHLTRHLVLTRSYDALSTTVGAVAIGLLIAVLVVRELARDRREPRRARVVDIVVVPLLLAFAVIVTVRFRHLMP